MRALFEVAPGHGHLNPVVPLAREVAARHDVLVATSASFCPTVREAGLDPVPVGLDWLESEAEQSFPELAGLDPAETAFRLRRIFEYAAPRTVVPDLRALAARWRPDVVVTEPGSLAARLLAELEGIPQAMVNTRIPFPRFHAMLPTDDDELLALHQSMTGRESVRGLRVELGLPPDDDDQLGILFDQVPPSLHLLTARHLSRVTHPIRPVTFNARSVESEPIWRLPRDRPTVHLSLGTVFNRDPAPLRAVLAGLAGLRCNLVVGLGGVPAAELADVAGDALLLPWVPHDRFLPRCDLFVTHGGWGSVIAALGVGVPLLVLPQAADQVVHALRVRSAGAGRFLLAGEVTPGAVRLEVERLLEEPVYRLNAVRLQREVEEMPAPEEGARLLEVLARTGGPVPAEDFPPRPRLAASSG